MLDIMRKQAGSWMIKIILGAIIVVFCFWGIGSWTSQKANVVAKVNDETILSEEYGKAYDQLLEQFRGRFGNQLDEDMVESLNLRGQALNQLVDRKLMLQEAYRRGLRVTDQEVAAAIREVPAFQNNGRFDERRYANLLNSNRLTPETFEAMQRDSMLIGKLQRIAIDSVKVSDAEVKAWYEWQGAEVNIETVLFEPTAYTIESADEDAVKRYFDSHRDNYNTEAQREAVYLRYPFKEYADQIKISPEEVKAYYDANTEEFRKAKTVEARHILFKVDENAPAETVESQRKKAEKVLALAREGEDFAALAKKYSEGPTRDNGGYLGTFEQQSMVKPFADKAFSMAAGDVSDPVRTRFGWHIIKVEKVNPAGTLSLDAARDQIVKRLTDQRAKAIAYDQAESAFDAYDDNLGLKAFAADGGLKLMETGLFGSRGPKNVPDASGFARTAFQVAEGELSDITELADGYYLIQVVKDLPSKPAAYDAVKDDVKRDFIAAEQDKAAMADAKTLLEALVSGEDFVKASQKYEKLPSETGYFKRNGEIPGIGYETELAKAAFELTAAKPLPEEAVKGKNGYFVFRLKDRKLPDPDGLRSQRERIEQMLLRREQSRAAEKFLADIRSRSDIYIDPKYTR